MSIKEQIREIKSSNPSFGSKKIAAMIGCTESAVRFHINSHYRKTVTKKRVERRGKRKLMLIQLLGGKCIVCGYNNCPEALDFHHTDPAKKEFRLSELLNSTNERVIAEAQKCVLLCCRCHREHHAGCITVN